MAKNNTIPVRLDDSQLAAVQRHAARFGVSDAQFLRWAIDALLKYVDHHGGNLPLPIDFTQHWKTALQLAEEAIRAGDFPKDAFAGQSRLNEAPLSPTLSPSESAKARPA